MSVENAIAEIDQCFGISSLIRSIAQIRRISVKKVSNLTSFLFLTERTAGNQSQRSCLQKRKRTLNSSDRKHKRRSKREKSKRRWALLPMSGMLSRRNETDETAKITINLFIVEMDIILVASYRCAPAK